MSSSSESAAAKQVAEQASSLSSITGSDALKSSPVLSVGSQPSPTMPILQSAADIALQQTMQQRQQQQQQQTARLGVNAAAIAVDAGDIIVSQPAAAADSQQSSSGGDATHSGQSVPQLQQATQDAARLRAEIRRIWSRQLDACAVLNDEDPPESISDVWFRASLSSIDFRCVYNVYALAYGQSPEQIHVAIVEALGRHTFWADTHERVNCRCSDRCQFIRRVKNFVCHDVVDGSPKTAPTEIDTLRKQADNAISAWEQCDTSDSMVAGATAAAANAAVLQYIQQHWSKRAFGGDALLQLYAHHQQDRVAVIQWDGMQHRPLPWSSSVNLEREPQAVVFVTRLNKNHFWVLCRRHQTKATVQFYFSPAEVMQHAGELFRTSDHVELLRKWIDPQRMDAASADDDSNAPIAKHGASLSTARTAVAARPAILVLGMAFVKEEWLAKPRGNNSASSLQYLATCRRDRARLQQLQQHCAPALIISADDSAVGDDKFQANQHVHCSFRDSSKAVSALSTLLTQQTARLEAVYADYFCASGSLAKMLARYREFLQHMLPLLLFQGILGPGARIILPHPRTASELLRSLAVKYSGPEDSQLQLELTPITAVQSPLFVATSNVPASLLGTLNSESLQQLNSQHPFITLLVSTATASARTSAHTSFLLPSPKPQHLLDKEAAVNAANRVETQAGGSQMIADRPSSQSVLGSQAASVGLASVEQATTAVAGGSHSDNPVIGPSPPDYSTWKAEDAIEVAKYLDDTDPGHIKMLLAERGIKWSVTLTRTIAFSTATDICKVFGAAACSG